MSRILRINSVLVRVFPKVAFAPKNKSFGMTIDIFKSRCGAIQPPAIDDQMVIPPNGYPFAAQGHQAFDIEGVIHGNRCHGERVQVASVMGCVAVIHDEYRNIATFRLPEIVGDSIDEQMIAGL